MIEAFAISIFQLGNRPLFFLRPEGEAGCFQFLRVERFCVGFQIAILLQCLIHLSVVLGLSRSE